MEAAEERSFRDLLTKLAWKHLPTIRPSFLACNLFTPHHFAALLATTTYEMALKDPTPQKHTGTNFMSLPRELRDQVYKELTISSKPVLFNGISGPIVYDVEDSLLAFSTVPSQLTREACEMFYQQNYFVILDGDLPCFLESSIHLWTLHTCHDHMHTTYKAKSVVSNISAWITKIEVLQEQSMYTDYEELGMGLDLLSTCPQLHTVVIDTGRGFWRKLDNASRVAIEELTKRLGAGLKVHMEGSGYRSGVEYLF